MIQFIPAIAVSLAAGLVTYLIARKEQSNVNEKPVVESRNEHTRNSDSKQRPNGKAVHRGRRVTDNVADHPTKKTRRSKKDEESTDKSGVSGDSAGDDSARESDDAKDIRKTQRVKSTQKPADKEGTDNDDGKRDTDDSGDNNGGDVPG